MPPPPVGVGGTTGGGGMDIPDRPIVYYSLGPPDKSVIPRLRLKTDPTGQF